MGMYGLYEDEMHALQDQVDALTAERDRARDGMMELGQECSKLMHQRDLLRDALENILKSFGSCEKDNMEFSARITCWQMDKARDALKTAVQS